MPKKILVFLAHPDYDSFCGYLADRYAESAEKAGHEVRRANIGDLQFDPILHKGYKVIQELEPDLKKLQEDMRWCDHLVVLYPNWWCTMPAVLKGLFDRMWLPGFAFRFPKTGWKHALGLWDRLLTGKTARVIITMNTPPWLARLLYGDYSNEIRCGILWFSGFSTKVTSIGPIEKMYPEQRARWGRKIEGFGRHGM